MSAETARRTSRPCGQTVRPETVVEKSFMESVSGIINEVAPTSYTQSLNAPSDHRETVLWARFEQCDANDVAGFTEATEANGNVAPLVLVLGYSSGVQVWMLSGSGEAQEVLSWRQGVARDARLLPTPEPPVDDQHRSKRPLLALCDAAGTETKFCAVSLISLRSGEQVKSIKFKSGICSVMASRRVLVVTFLGKLAVFDAGTFEDRFTVTTCYPSPGLLENPVALGHRWLAYGEKRLNGYMLSRGGMCSESSPSYTATVLYAAKSITKGIRELGEGLACKLGAGGGAGAGCAGSRYSTSHGAASGSGMSAAAAGGGGSAGGVAVGGGVGAAGGLVTVLDVVAASRAGCAAGGSQQPATDAAGVIAHFQAHTAAVVHLCFDASGSLLLTADKSGNSFHVFRVQAHAQRSALASVHHIYTLYRGDTSAKVLDMTFSADSRWAAVATHRGTTHLFPVCPYGGPISTRTHCGPRVVNKLSRFHRSAGFHETCHGSGDRNSPVPRLREISGGGSAALSPSVLVPPLAQLRQPILTQLTATGSSSGGTRGSPTTDHDATCHVRVVSSFAAPRGSLPSSVSGPSCPSTSSASSRDRRPVDALFVLANNGSLIEYHVDPRPAGVIAKDRVPQDAPIEVSVHAHAQWTLTRQLTWPELRPPLSASSPLLLPPVAALRPATSNTSLGSHQSDPGATEHWVSQVEILTHSGPHRRLWMGPQFSFRPFCQSTVCSTVGVQLETRDLLTSVRSSPVNMPAQIASLSIECGSANSYEPSPRMSDSLDASTTAAAADEETGEESASLLRQRLAEAMSELEGASPAVASVLPHLGARRLLGQQLDSARSSASSSSVDVRSSPDRAGSPLDFSVYEHAASSCATPAAATGDTEEALAEAGWGEDILLCPRLVPTEMAAAAADTAAAAADRTSDDERPTPSTKRRGKKKRR